MCFATSMNGLMQNASINAWCLQELREDFDIDVRILGITNSRQMLLSDSPINIDNWESKFAE